MKIQHEPGIWTMTSHLGYRWCHQIMVNLDNGTWTNSHFQVTWWCHGAM